MAAGGDEREEGREREVRVRSSLVRPLPLLLPRS